MRQVTLGLVSIVVLIFNATACLAQNYPSKPIRIITSGVGGGGDFTSRLLAPGLTASLGQPIVVDNRASGFPPGQAVAQAAPDGYTLLMYGATMYLETLLRSSAPYDPVRDFSPVILVSFEPQVLVVHPSLPAKSVKELVALAKARPGELNYSSSTGFTAGFIAGELFQSLAGVKIVRVAYKVTGQQFPDLVSGTIHMTFAGAAATAPFIKSGRLRALATTSAQPSALFPGLPTVAATLPGYELVSITGIWAPAKTPDAIVNRLDEEFARVLNQPDVKAKMLAAGSEVVAMPADKFGPWMKADIARMNKVIKDAHVSVE